MNNINDLFKLNEQIHNLKMIIDHKSKNVRGYLSEGLDRSERDQLRSLEEKVETIKRKTLLKG